MGDTIRVGLLGCGTVGTGILRILAEHRTDIVARLGKPIEVVRILVRDPERERDPAVPRHLLTTSPDELFAADTHIIVEVLGGYEPARTLLLRALASGRHVVTANKALLARHGSEVFRAADDAHRDVVFEASVGGGIPVIRMLREGFAADRIRSLRAIINGTSNYMLTGMAQRGAAYADVLAEAQLKGYAEADPTMDVGGFDAAQKLAILISVSFGVDIPFETIRTEGIERLSPLDFAVAKQFGYAVKPLAIARATDASAIADGAIEARVAPALVPADSLLAHVNGVFNAVMVDAHALGPMVFYGQGAGMMPTAAAVVSDIIELGRDIDRGTSGRLPHLAFHKDLVEARGLLDPDAAECPFYLRFSVKDVPGVIAQITTILGAHHISIRRMVQEQSEPGQSVPVVLLTHSAREGAVRAALRGIDALPFVTERTCLLRVEDIP